MEETKAHHENLASRILYLPALLYFIGFILAAAQPGGLLGLYLIPWVYFADGLFRSEPVVIPFGLLNLALLIVAAALANRYAKRFMRAAVAVSLVLSVGMGIWLLNAVLIALLV